MAEDDELSGAIKAPADEPKPEEPKPEEPKPDEPKPDEPKAAPVGAVASRLAADLGLAPEVARERLEHVAAAIARRQGCPVCDAMHWLCRQHPGALMVLCARSDDEAAKAALDVCGADFSTEG